MNSNQSSICSPKSPNENNDLSEIEKPKSSGSPKSQFSKRFVKTKNVYVKMKVASKPEVTLENYESKMKKEENDFMEKFSLHYKKLIHKRSIFVEINLCDNKMEVYKMENGAKKTLIRNHFG